MQAAFLRGARRVPVALVSLAAALVLACLAFGPNAGAQGVARVYVNGQSVPATFNDGDSMRVRGGDYAGRQTRLAGFNTLESYGPVHHWGDWHPYELYVNAKQATLNARRGVWHCTTDGEEDTYGRVLMDCPDLAVDQIRKGLAHAMNIDDPPARPEYLRAQQEAIRHRRGMWAHGVPEFIMTSLHSNDERLGTSYNRLVATRDGHSEKMEHTDIYAECSWVCAETEDADDQRVRSVARALRANPNVAPAVAEISNLLLVEIVDRWARLGELPEWVGPEVAAAVRGPLERARSSGALGQPVSREQSCVLYVGFDGRYGRERATCLRGHGERPPR